MANMEDTGTSYNRVFVLGGKDLSKDDFKDEFSKWGEIKDIWMVEDRKSGEFKGITYITFSKASEAALAIEEMNGKMLGKSAKPLKVLLANDKREGSVRDSKESERMMRLFIMVPKSDKEDEIKKTFEQYGKVEYVRLLKDRHSGDSKGLAFVSYYRAYHCALALEQCDPSFKAVFAAPKESRERSETWDDPYDMYNRSSHNTVDKRSYGRRDEERGYEGRRNNSHNDFMSTPVVAMPPPVISIPSPMSDLMRNFPTTGPSSLEVMSAPGITQEQLHSLLDLTPGLAYCDIDPDSNVAFVQYKFPQCAAYAKEKLSFLEYPPGYRIAVRYPQAQSSVRSSQDLIGQATSSLSQSLQSLEGGDIQSLGTLVESIKKATDILSKAGLHGTLAPMTTAAPSSEERVRHCNVPLPLTRPFAPRDSPLAERVFIVSRPEAFGLKYLHDVFCRFGDFIDGFFMPGKNFGYIKYASKEAAEAAMRTLHEQIICGMKVKVMKADPPTKSEHSENSHGAKRARIS